MPQTNTFTVIYRTGGTVNFQWHRTLTSERSREALKTFAAGIERMGYKARVVTLQELAVAGLPHNFIGDMR